jgi:ubiquinone/menaquinone biosynthesis C-methylase UbiE
MSERSLDPDGLRYLQHWEPVLSAPAWRTLERFQAQPRVFLDLGTGTGSLALAAAERWPSARIVALDASEAMLAVARSRVVADGDADPSRFEWLSSDAAAIPLDDAAVDTIASSFMLQLATDRPAVLREALRVLRPGGNLSLVTWLADDLVLPADEAYHDLVGDLGGDDDDEGSRSRDAGDYLSLEQAYEELAEAGFEAVEVVPDQLHYAWRADAYLAFKVDYDDQERFDTLEPAARERLIAALTERLATLPPEDFEVRGPLVAAVGRKPATGTRPRG